MQQHHKDSNTIPTQPRDRIPEHQKTETDLAAIQIPSKMHRNMAQNLAFHPKPYRRQPTIRNRSLTR
jgi:hypothetical protein